MKTETELTTMKNWGTGVQGKSVLFTYHPSLVVQWWQLVHSAVTKSWQAKTLQSSSITDTGAQHMPLQTVHVYSNCGSSESGWWVHRNWKAQSRKDHLSFEISAFIPPCSIALATAFGRQIQQARILLAELLREKGQSVRSENCFSHKQMTSTDHLQ